MTNFTLINIMDMCCSSPTVWVTNNMITFLLNKPRSVAYISNNQEVLASPFLAPDWLICFCFLLPS
uniref:Uncharacterized protein n=1 Tax=Anguilla anguilla TaxID=7936 RepID=A0A0E9XAA9_ANGAN